MIFVQKGVAPLTPQQLNRRTQKYIDRDWPAWKRERAIRKGDATFDVFMDTVELDTDVNRETNTFNWQLQEYTKAVSRLTQYIIADGRVELTEMQPTGEQVFNEVTMEMDDVTASVIIQTFIEPVEATVEVTSYSDDSYAVATVTTVTNPLIATDTEEREAAQAVVNTTPLEVTTHT
tara:strand:- start:4143 stop:4673 length:531 start_codon:yes stop_codon:yes gene_type:complete